MTTQQSKIRNKLTIIAAVVAAVAIGTTLTLIWWAGGFEFRRGPAMAVYLLSTTFAQLLAAAWAGQRMYETCNAGIAEHNAKKR